MTATGEPAPPVRPDMSIAEFRRLGHQAVELAADYLERIRERPVFQPMTPAERRHLTDQRLTDAGLSPDTLLADFAEHVLPYAMGNGHPRFFGWVNSPPAPIGIIAELLAATQDPSCDVGDIAPLYLETCVVRWLGELVGLPPDTSTGLLVSGGSVASLTCLTVARQRAAEAGGWDVRERGLQGADRPRLTAYTSQEGHSSLRKAMELLGLGSSALRQVPTDDRFRIDLAALRDRIRADRRDGDHPFCVIASAGTVNTGAVDPLDALAELCAREGLWLHVDGAYGALGVLHPELAADYAGLGAADSVSLDPHKWLSVPIECGCAIVQDRDLMRRAFSYVPPYLRTEEGSGIGGPPSFAEYGIQQTRGFRALKLWMTLQYTGRDGITDLVTRNVALARYLAGRVETAADLDLMAPVQLSVVCFRYVPDGLGGDDAAIAELNRAIEYDLQSAGSVFVTSTTLRGVFTLRACVLHYGTTRQDVDTLVEAVREAGARLARPHLAAAAER